jgi:hypothetical protein
MRMACSAVLFEKATWKSAVKRRNSSRRSRSRNARLRAGGLFPGPWRVDRQSSHQRLVPPSLQISGLEAGEFPVLRQAATQSVSGVPGGRRVGGACGSSSGRLEIALKPNRKF